MPAILLRAVILVLALRAALAAEPVIAPSSASGGHRFACADYSQGKIFVISTNGVIEWQYTAPSCDDLWVLPNGNLLFNTGHGVKEVTPAKQVVFSYESKSEIYACQRLPNGNTFVGECNAGRLLEIDRAGHVVKKISLLPPGKDGGHLYMRNARVLGNGHYLVAHYAAQVVREYDPTGRCVLEIAAPGGPHSAVRLPNDHTLVACGDLTSAASVFEVDAAGHIVWQLRHNELPGIDLKLMTGLQRLPNGNTVMSNWQGHGNIGSGPQLIEVTPGKQLVWSFTDHKILRTISSVQILDVPGDAIKGQVFH